MIPPLPYNTGWIFRLILERNFSGNIISILIRITAGKLYANIPVISCEILDAQTACAVARLADARRLLLCVCMSDMLLAACETLSALYYLRGIDVTLYLFNEWLYFFTCHRGSDLSDLGCSREIQYCVKFILVLFIMLYSSWSWICRVICAWVVKLSWCIGLSINGISIELALQE